MSYIVLCTFDLENASSQDYENAYSDLKEIGLKKVVISNQGNEIVIPTTSTIGEFPGTSSSSIRDKLRNKVKSAFKNRGFDSEIFILVGDNWTWAATTT